MAKRFIDTGIFTDKWFMSLTKDSKLFWIYLITNCNHAGIIEINEQLAKFQTGIKSLETVIKELDKRLHRLENDYFFIPKFLEYQYNNFPNSGVRAQKSAIDILIKFKLWDEEKQTVIKELNNSYVYGSGYVPKKISVKEFYEEQLKLSENDETYKRFIDWLFGENILKRPLNNVLSMKEQISWKQFPSVVNFHNEYKIKISDVLIDLENWLMKNKDAKNTTVLGTLRTFAKRAAEKQ